VRVVWLAVLVACAHPLARTPVIDGPEQGSHDRHYTIWLGGARVGTATESETWSREGVVLRRDETMQFFRGDALVKLATTIEIAADRALVPSRVTWSERGKELHHAEATRDAAGWHVDGATLPADAIPAELVPLVTRRDGRFAGRVFLPARGFLVGTGRIDAVAPARLVARLALDGGAVAEATIDVDADGAYARVVDGEGVIAIRTTPALAAAPFQPVDLIAATSIAISGARGHTIIVDGDVAVPPVPGQLAGPDPDGIAIQLSSRLPGALPPAARGRDRTSEILALVAYVGARIAPDLGAHASSARDASSATAGDCTTFALAYAALAARRSIPTRVVTGMRVDGDRLVRHRWAVSWTGRAWIAVDAAFGAAPAGGDLIGLAVHDADDAGLVAGEAALTQIRSATWR
jgi:hypothetical protein